ncbi:GNAT family N-acetyltransferase [Nocardia sp. NPDC049149]|uniref:GNAT family N-acetyltransferase n=1 Tax=Nocardia sp. NPDC049149 TaxID=3364315 RepID=UPI00371C1672
MNSNTKVIALGAEDAGEILTLQRAAYVTEARAHNDVHLAPLTQTLPDLLGQLARPDIMALGIRENARLVAAIRILLDGRIGRIGRMTVAPDRQGDGLGSTLLLATETSVPEQITELRLFVGEHAHDNLRVYDRFGYRDSSELRQAITTSSISSNHYHAADNETALAAAPAGGQTDRHGRVVDHDRPEMVELVSMFVAPQRRLGSFGAIGRGFGPGQGLS